MTAQVEHRNHHEKATAYGTSGHTHHRRRMEQDGVAVGYWACEKVNWAPCPDEPDPFARLLVKLAERVVPVDEPERLHSRDRCRYGHGAEFQTWNNQHHPICVECRRLASLKAGMKRAADRIAA